jgi:mRNA interferase HigB
MKIHLVKEKTVRGYILNNPGCQIYFEEWLARIKRADWDKPSDILYAFNTADILGKGYNRVVFNVGGNKYRIICQYLFGDNEVHLFVCWIGTHPEYDKVCADKKQYSINNY